MRCPICRTELQYKGFSVGESEARSNYYCSECKHNLHYDGAPWFAYIPVDLLKRLHIRIENLEEELTKIREDGD